jgi:CRP/FNR family cyclic AMP-dependent transcriptional regulator
VLANKLCDGHNKHMLASKAQYQKLVDFFHKGTRLTYDKGEFIIRPGESPPGVFYIESGLVKAFDITKYGEENLLIVRREGEFLGLTWAVTGEDRHIIYEALAPTVVWVVKRETFANYVQKHAESALPLLDMVTDMYRLHSARILNLEYRTVRERLISYLLSMAQRFGKKGKDGVVIEVPLRHQDIASSINSSRETTSREMAYLERKDLVYNHQLYVTLRDVKKLRDYL